MTNFSRRTKRLSIILAVVALLAAGGAWYYSGRVLPADASASAAESAIKTTRVRRGNLVVSASATGVLVPVSEVDLSFRAGGVLAAVNCAVGDWVEAGAVLAQLDTIALERSVIQAEISLRQAEIRLEIAQEPVDDASLQRAQDAVDQAAASVRLAQIGLAAAEDDVAVNEALEDARAAYEEALNVHNDWLNEYDEARADYWWVEDSRLVLDEAQLALSRAEQQADQIVQSARNELARATDLYNQIQNDLEELVVGPDASDIESLKLDLELAQLNLAAAQDNLSNGSLMAPFDGVVAAVQAQPGETVGTTPIITLADLEHPLLELYVDETDLHKVATGYEVEVVLDALPEEVFTGHVVRIEPGLILVEGLPMIQALATLQDESLTEGEFLPAGLNARVEIVSGKAENAVLVPVEALKELAPGSYSVFVVIDEQLVPRPVQVGLMDLSYAEILSGLEQGEVVSTGAVETE
jgi:HlyD family secretion protein